jgi:HAAS
MTAARNAAEPRLAAYLTEVAARLHGPHRRRARILAELHDGLDQAVADRARDGLAPEQAADAALDGFGTPTEVATAFAGELAVAYARRTLAWFVVTGPLVGIWWLLLLQPEPWRTGVVALLAAIPALPLIGIAVATAMGTFATTGRLMRWLPEATPQRALLATVAVAVLAFTADTALIAGYAWSALPARLVGAVAVAASLTRMTCSAVTARHALRAAGQLVRH